MPDAPFVHVMVVDRRRDARRHAARSTPGDAVRLTDAGALDLAATDDGTEITIWEMWADLEVALTAT